jgi:5-methylcytosine-specific restriction endonuclease McrA
MKAVFPKPKRRKRIGSRWARPDEEATQLAGFLDRRSWIGHKRNGKPYRRLFGRDRSLVREQVLNNQQFKCAICKRRITSLSAELDEIHSHGKGGDDSVPNLQMICGRYTKHRCHVLKHNRFPKWGQEDSRESP